MSASKTPIVPELPYEILMPLFGKPILSTMLAIRSGGITRGFSVQPDRSSASFPRFSFRLVRACEFLSLRHRSRGRNPVQGTNQGRGRTPRLRRGSRRRTSNAAAAPIPARPDSLASIVRNNVRTRVGSGRKSLSATVRHVATSRMMVLVAQEKMRHCRHQRIGQNVEAIMAKAPPPSPTAGTDNRRPRLAKEAVRKRCRISNSAIVAGP